MDPDLGIGPVEHGLPAQEVVIFHIRKRTLDLRLTAIGEDNLLIAPALLVGEQDAFPQLMFLELGEGRGTIALTKVDPHLCSDNWPTNRFTANVLSAVCLCFSPSWGRRVGCNGDVNR